MTEVAAAPAVFAMQVVYTDTLLCEAHASYADDSQPRLPDDAAS